MFAGLAAVATASCSLAAAHRIILDGQFDDWSAVPAFSDPVGDTSANGGGVDFAGLRAANDERSVLLEITLTQPRPLQDMNAIALYIDADLNAATGLAEGDIGAELVWRFGQRVGTNYTASGPRMIVIGDVGLRPAPAVTSARFEIALPRNLTLFGQRIFNTNAIRVALRGNGAVGDRLPDSGNLLVPISDDPLPVLPVIPVGKTAGCAVRVMTWNTLDGGVFDPNRQQRFRRVIQALEPEILVLQEMAGRSRESTRQLIASWLPQSPAWNVVANDGSLDAVILSRYPVLGWWIVFGSGTFSSTAALIDTRGTIGRETLVVAAHLTCCANDAARDSEVTQVMSFLRDAITPGGRLTIPRQAGIILLGDLNLVGKAEQLTTLLEGPLVQNTRQAPDWNDTPFALLAARHNAVPDTFTWRANLPGIRFYPSQLDFMIYSDSVLKPVRQFVFQTESLPADQLAALGLTADEVFQASDHAPVIADFSPAAPDLRINRTATTAQLTIFLAPDSPVQLQHSENFRDWQDFLPAMGSSNGPISVNDSEVPASGRRFYRARQR